VLVSEASDAATGLSDGDLPGLFAAADASSLSAQRQHRRSTAIVLSALIAAAIGGVLPAHLGPGATNWGGVMSAGAFVVALLFQLVLARRPERAWYEGRAIAESVKSLGWQFAVGGGDYGPDSNEARPRFLCEIGCLLTDIGEARPFDLPPQATQITPAMNALRSAGLPARQAAYLKGRIEDQRSWYSSKARWNRERASVLLWVTMGFEAAGGITAVLRAAGVFEVDLLGICSAVVAGLIAWSQLKAHVQLDEAYSLASHELGVIQAAADDVHTEDRWRDFVANAEQAISREHRMWRAARSTRLP